MLKRLVKQLNTPRGSGVLAIIIVAIGIAVVYFYQSNRMAELKKYPSVSPATVIDYSGGSKGDYLELKLKFTGDDGKEYHTTKTCFHIRSADGYSFLGKSIPVLFSFKHPDYNQVLLFRDDFKEFNMLYPDSLRWALRYCTE